MPSAVFSLGSFWGVADAASADSASADSASADSASADAASAAFFSAALVSEGEVLTMVLSFFWNS